MAIVPVILSGGSGTRLWPLSREVVPKQFAALVDHETLIQLTARRAARIPGASLPLVVANASHVDLIRTQMSEPVVAPRLVVAEPAGRSTAPALALAARLLDPDDVMVVLTADSMIRDEAGFVDAVETAVKEAQAGALVTFGVMPSRAEIGYGYIEAERPGQMSRIVRFVEKPDPETAARFASDGRHLWNSGMFVFRVATLLSELGVHAPELDAIVARAVDGGREADGVFHPHPDFVSSPSISIDHAVMEHTTAGVVVPLDVGWSDVGSWHALWETSDQDPHGNVVLGSVVLTDVSRSYLRASDRLLAVLGLEDVVVVDTGDAILVASRERSQDLREVVERIPDWLR